MYSNIQYIFLIVSYSPIYREFTSLPHASRPFPFSCFYQLSQRQADAHLDTICS